MPRVYTVVLQAVAVTAAVDLFELTPADDKPIEIIGFEIGQTTDSGDAQDEQIRLSIGRGNATSGSGGSGPTPIPIEPNDAAAGFTAEVANTTQASAGTLVALTEHVFNVRAGMIQWFPEICRPKANQGNTTIVGKLTAPSDSLTYSATIYVLER